MPETIVPTTDSNGFFIAVSLRKLLQQSGESSLKVIFWQGLQAIKYVMRAI
jgi:hypothetical protein